MGIMGKKEYKEACQPEGNYFDKYGSNNPIVKRLMKGYFDSFGKLLGESGISRGGVYPGSRMRGRACGSVYAEEDRGCFDRCF